jgi:hypothetical protein
MRSKADTPVGVSITLLASHASEIAQTSRSPFYCQRRRYPTGTRLARPYRVPLPKNLCTSPVSYPAKQNNREAGCITHPRSDPPPLCGRLFARGNTV